MTMAFGWSTLTSETRCGAGGGAVLVGILRLRLAIRFADRQTELRMTGSGNEASLFSLERPAEEPEQKS